MSGVKWVRIYLTGISLKVNETAQVRLELANYLATFNFVIHYTLGYVAEGQGQRARLCCRLNI